MIKGILLVKFNEPFQRKDSMNEKDVEVKIVIYKSFLWYFFQVSTFDSYNILKQLFW